MAINRDKILQEAQKLVEKKRFDKAIAEYQKVVADDPNDVRTLLKIGDLYLRMQQFADAISIYDRVASYYSIQGFSVKAVAVYKQIREIVQKHAPHLEDRFGHVVPKLAELLTQLDLRSDALAYYDEMAARLQTMGRDRDAIDVFRKIVSLDSANPVSHLRLADAYTRVRDFDASTEEFMAAAEILLNIGRRDDALRVVERILQYRQEPKFARLAAEILLDRAAPNDAMGALQKLQVAFKANPRDLDTLALLARAFDGLGQSGKAVDVLKEAARIARESGARGSFEQLVMSLLSRAPNDEGVQQLVLLMRSDSKVSVAPPSATPASVYPQLGPPMAPTARAPSEPPAYVAASAPSPGTDRRQAAPAKGPFVAPAARQPIPSAPVLEAEEAPPSLVEEISVADLVVEDYESEPPGEPASEDEPPIPLRSSYPPSEISDPQNRLREIFASVESARRASDYAVAANILRRSILQMPQARELRERLCDVLIESGDQDGAIFEMLSFARHLVEEGDQDAAARLLDEVLLLEPNNRPALDLLRALGYAVATPEDEVLEAPADARAKPPGYDPSAPLPSYDLDELTADEIPIAPHLIPSVPGTAEPPRMVPRHGLREPSSPQVQSPPVHPSLHAHGAPPIQLDDPFASEQTSFGMPAYALDEPAPQRTSQPGVLDESALEEIEFFVTHGMLDEAEGMLAEQLARLPTHPLLLEKHREIQVARQAQAGARGPRAAEAAFVPPKEAPRQSAAPPPSVHVPSSVQRPSVHTREVTVDRAYDIAHALDEMDNALDSFGPRSPSPQQGQVSVEQVFEQFKAGVAAQIAEGDAATHYDLGVAYKEMGLISDAIHEFELASRDPSRECVCQSMIGMLHMQDNDLDRAIDAFIRGLHVSHKTPDQELALTYEIGNAYELRNNAEQALYYFQLVARLDPSHRDPRGSVAERIAGLERRTGHDKAAPKAVAVGAGDEFDAAFDDLFNPKG